MKIYTKTGDSGQTGLQGNKRVSKANPRIIAYGAVDEINAFLGLILAHKMENKMRDLFTKLQNDLFVLGADLSNPDLTLTKNRINAKMVEDLENRIDLFEKELPPITNFILPGGDTLSSLVHITRAITRRAETCVIILDEKEQVNIEAKKYLNRLSDLLFVLARTINKNVGIEDKIWKP